MNQSKSLMLHIFDPAILDSAEDVSIEGVAVSVLVTRDGTLYRLSYSPRVAPGLRVEVHVDAMCVDSFDPAVALARGVGVEHPEVREFFEHAQAVAFERRETERDRRMARILDALFP